MFTRKALLFVLMIVLTIGGWVHAQEGALLQVITAENAGRLEEIASIDSGMLGGNFDWSPDGSRIAITGPTAITLYDTANPDVERLLLPFRDEPEPIADAFYPTEFTRDGRIVLLNMHSTIFTWDAETGERLAVIEPKGLLFFLLSPDSETLVTLLVRTAADEPGFSIATWNLRDGAVIAEYEGGDYEPSYAVLSQDGRFLAVKGHRNEDNSLSTWDLETGERLAEVAGPKYGANDLAFLHDGQSLAVATWSNSLLIYNTRTLALENALTAGYFGDPWIYQHPNRPLLALPGDNAFLTLFDTERDAVLAVLGDTALGAPTFSPDGALLAWGSGYGTHRAYVLDMQTLQIRTMISYDNPADPDDGSAKPRLATYAITPNNHAVVLIRTLTDPQTNETNEALALYSVASGAELWSLELGDTAVIHRVLVSPDGRALALSQGGSFCCGGETGNRIITWWGVR